MDLRRLLLFQYPIRCRRCNRRDYVSFRSLTFTDEGKIRELARRGETWGDSESQQMLDYAIANGEGGMYLRLSPDQYARLRRP
jgi:hypothetical protein